MSRADGRSEERKERERREATTEVTFRGALLNRGLEFLEGPEVEPGTSIAVYWDLDRKWYNAEVLNYDPVTGIYKLLYTDGEREELDLTAVKYSRLRGGKSRERMVKAGGDISKKQSIEYIVKTLLDVEDRLPPRGVHNNKKRWWSAWHSRVSNAGKSGNIADLAKASVEIAFQMNDDVSTSWWKSQRVNWQKQVESSTTSVVLSSRLTDLLTKAVDWNAARLLFSSEFSESDRKKTVVAGGQDAVSMDRSGVDEKGNTGSKLSAREQRMMERERRDRKKGIELDEDSGVKKSKSNSAELGVRRSKRKRIVVDEDEVSQVDSPPRETPVVNLTIAENRPSIVKRIKGGNVDEGCLSDPIQHKLDKAYSETDSHEDQSSVDDTKRKKCGRKENSIETRKHEQGTEDGQGSGIDLKTHIGYARVRRSTRSLGSDRSEAGQTSDTTASERNVPSVSNEPTLGAGNFIDLQEREESTELKDTTISIRSASVRTRSSTVKNEHAHEEPRKFSGHEESTPTQECGSVKVSEVQMGRKRGRPKRTRTYQLEKEDADGKEKIRNSAESPGGSAATNFGLSAQDSNVVPREAIVTRVETRLQRARHAEDEIDRSGDPVGRVKRIIKTPHKCDGAHESLNPADDHAGLSAQDSNVLPCEAIVSRVETRLQRAGHTKDEIDDCSGDPFGRFNSVVEQTQKYDAVDESINPADDHVGVSAQDSNAVPREAIVTRVETRLQKACHTEDEIDDSSGDPLGRVNNIIEQPQKFDAVDESINPADDHVGVSAQDSNAVPREEIVTRVETRLQKAVHTKDEIADRSGDPFSRVNSVVEQPQKYDAVDESINPADDHVGVSAQDSNAVPREAIVTRVETRLQKACHTEDEIDDSSGDLLGRVSNIIEQPPNIDAVDESINPADDHVGVSAQDSNAVPREAIVTRVEKRQQKPGHTEDEIDRSGDPVGPVKRIIRKPQRYDAADESLDPLNDHVGESALDSSVVPREAIVSRVETRLQKACHTEDEIDDSSGDPLGRVCNIIEQPPNIDAVDESINPADDHVGVSALDSSVVPREAIVSRVETRLQKACHTEDEIDDSSGDPLGRVCNIIEQPPNIDAVDESINPADDHVGVSAQDSNAVPREAIVTRVEKSLQKPGHTEDEIDRSGDPVGRVKRISRKPQRYDIANESLNPLDSSVVPRETIVTRVEARLQNSGHTEDEIGRSGDLVGRVRRIIRKPHRYDAVDDHAGVSAQDSNVLQREAIDTQVETRLQNVGRTEDESGASGNPVGRVKRTIKKPQKYDAADESLKPPKVQNEGKQGRVGTKVEVKQVNVSIGADVVRYGKEDWNTRADEENLSLGLKAMEPEEGEDGAERRPSISDSRADIRQTKRGRVVQKVSESKLNEKQNVQGIDPSLLLEADHRLSSFNQVEEHSFGTAVQDGSVKLEKKTAGDEEVQELQQVKPGDAAVGFKNLEEQAEISEELDPVNEVARKRDPPGIGVRLKEDIELKQTRATASIARSERTRVRSGGARLEVLDEHETEESSGEEEPNRASRFTRSRRKRSSRNRTSSFDINYEETTSGSNSEEDSEEYKVEDDEDDEEEPEIVALEDSWGERLPTDDSDIEDDAPSQSELKELQLGQAALSLDQPETVGDEKCSVCDFAGADELMLLCDQSGCTCALHTFCLTPPLKAIPEGEWFCPNCTRVRANPSDTGRLPKTCSIVKYPSKVLGSIIGRRREPSQEEGKTKIQYLVKWDSLSHEHDTWVPEDWLLFMHNRLVTNFQRKHSLLSESNFNVDERRPEWLQVDRIIACRKQGSKVPVKPSQVSALLRSRQENKIGVEFLVKWQTLEHKGATWEHERKTDEFQQAIACYTKRHERVEENGSTEEKAKPGPAIKKQPDYLSGGIMYTFQLHGLRWLLSNFEQGRSVILADEMGLGKTIQALAFISCVRYEKLSSRPVLVIAPKSTLPGWEQEFRCWAPGLNVIVYQGDKENRALIREHEFHSASRRPLFEVLLTSYELAAFDNTLLSRFHWASLIVDEGHRVKNVRSKLGTLLKRHKADFRLLLTGTPVQNTLTELFALLHFLDPKEFPDPEYSAQQFTEMDVRANNGQTDSKVIEQQVARLHEVLNPRMLRRLKTEVLRDMIPGKKVVEVSCALTPLQRHLYIAILKKNFKVLNKGVKSGLKRGLQMVLTDLKMVCNHPYLFPGKEPQHIDPSKAFKMLVAASGKLQLLEKLLPLLKEQGHRVLLFSQMTRMLDILEDFLAVLGLRYSRIDGSCSALSRQMSIEEFNAANSSTFIFLISTRAGGLGINLPTADTVIIYDPDFNPFVDLQAQARAHRIGQDKTVLVYQLITKCSVEEKILQRSRKKLAMENLVMSKEYKENTADINTLLLHGAQKLLDEDDMEATSIEFTDESVKSLLDREFLTSTTNADEPTAHGYLGAVEGTGFSSLTANEQEDKGSKGGDRNEWHELLHHLVEQDEQEELGRGKRVRKQVVYAVEGHPEGQEEDEYNPSSNDGESSSDSELSLDLEGDQWKAASARRKSDLGVGDVPTMEYPGMTRISGPMSSTVDTAWPFVPGGANVPVRPLPLNSPRHASMLSARGNSLQWMRSSASMPLPLPLQGTASFGAMANASPTLAAKLRELGTVGGRGSPSISSLPYTSRGATSSHMWPMSTNQTMSGDQARHIPAEAVALPSTTLLSGPGLNNTHFVSSPVPFPGVYPHTNNVNPHAVPSYPGIPVPPYTNYNVHPLPSHPLPSQFLLADVSVDPQNLTTANPAWATFSHLQQASQGWRIPDVEQMSAPAVAGIPWSAGGGYMLGGHHGSTGGHQLPITSSSNFQSTPSMQSGSGAAHQPISNSVKKKRMSDSSHLSSAAAAPWLAGYCTVSNSLSGPVEPKVISPSLATPPIPVPAVPVMPGVPYVPTLYPAFEFHDPTVLQVPPPAPITLSAPIRVPEPRASKTSAVVHSVPPAISSKGTVTSSFPHAHIITPPHLDFVKPVTPLDRNGSSCSVSPAEAPVMTSPYVGAAVSMPAPHPNDRYSKNRSPGLPMPQTLQSPLLGRTREVPTSETGSRAVDGNFPGGVPTGHCQPALAAVGKQTVTGKGSNILSAHELEGSGPPVAPKVMPQGRKPLWVPQGDARLLMGQSHDQGGFPISQIKVEEGSSQERSVLPCTSPQIRQKK